MAKINHVIYFSQWQVLFTVCSTTSRKVLFIKIHQKMTITRKIGKIGNTIFQNFFGEKKIYFFFSKLFKFTRKMRNVLKQIKNQFSDFCHFYFSSYGLFLYSKHSLFSMNFDHNSKNKDRKNMKYHFSFVSAHSMSFISIWPILRGRGGLHILR